MNKKELYEAAKQIFYDLTTYYYSDHNSIVLSLFGSRIPMDQCPKVIMLAIAYTEAKIQTIINISKLKFIYSSIEDPEDKCRKIHDHIRHIIHQYELNNNSTVQEMFMKNLDVLLGRGNI